MKLATTALFEPRSYVITARSLEGDSFVRNNPGWAISERLGDLPFRYMPGSLIGDGLVEVPHSHLSEPQAVEFEVSRWSRDAPPLDEAFDIMILTRSTVSGFEWTEYLEGGAK
ncbi:hypothetical protein [Brachybacterium squillarum]|uniref:hypothetical protein n=1 Tax=Brachybacterium squillarum TaxID=661979 RepID=UPI002222A09F|nr:hypothetical protein [Brachybacterium squillarum]MCW1805157.1 hypothetical protein [Brachybacterium squillarum]